MAPVEDRRCHFLVALHRVVRVTWLVLARHDAAARPSRPTNHPVVSAMASAWDGTTARVAGHRLRRRTGAVVNYAEDVHLREDVPCGCALCGTCANDDVQDGGHPVGTPLGADATHYLVPDADAIAEHVDFLEMPRSATNVIVLGSEVRRAHARGDARLSRRIRDVHNDRRRSVRMFPNEHCAHTSVVAAARDGGARARSGGGADDANTANIPNPTFSVFHDPVLRTAAWYAGKVRGAFPVVVLSESRAETLRGGGRGGGGTAGQEGFTAGADIAAEMRRRLPPGVEVLSASEYFPRFHAHDADAMGAFESWREAVEAQSLAASNGGIEPGTSGLRKRAFPPHWDADAIDAGLEDGDLMRGTIRVSSKRPDEATVRVGKETRDGDDGDDDGDGDGEDGGAHRGAHGRDLLIPTRTLRNRALDGDVVAVRLLPRSRWVMIDTGSSDAVGSDGASDSETGEESDEADSDDVTEDAGEESDKKDGVSRPPADSIPGPRGSSRRRRRLAPAAEVVGVLRRRGVDIVATIAEHDDDDDDGSGRSGKQNDKMDKNGALAIPMDRRFPRVRLLTRRARELRGQRLITRVTRWSAYSKHPEARVVKALGPAGDLAAETAAVLAECDVPLTNVFSPGAMNELPRVDSHSLSGPDTHDKESSWSVPNAELASRVDMRGVRTMSVDPPGCVDVDDALSVRQIRLDTRADVDADVDEYDEEVGYEVGVHIADVSHFVKAGSFLDLEAYARGTTVYLADGGRCDMLPALLSENVCSLLGGRERLAVSCVWTLDAHCRPVGGMGPDGSKGPNSPWFGRTVIRSNHQLNYYQAQAILDGVPPPTKADDLNDATETRRVRDDLAVLAAFARRCNAARTARGAVELASAELRFETCSDGVPRDVLTKGEVPMMRIVAELMIAANAAVAEKIVASDPRAFVRSHPPPRPEGFEELAGLMKRATGVTLDATDGTALANSLSSAISKATSSDKVLVGVGKRSENGRRSARAVAAATDALFRGMATRAMSEARYRVASGGVEGSNNSHYGLALTLYTHFTSPIRRYADVVVHRQLMDAVTGGGDGDGDEKSAPGTSKSFSSPAGLAKVADHLNERNRAAKRAQARCAGLYLLETLARRPRVERAVVHEIKDDGFVAFVPRFHVRVGVRLVSDTNISGKSRARGDDVDDATRDAVLPAMTTTFTEVRRRRRDLNPGLNDSDSSVASSEDVWMRADAPRAVAGVRLERRSDESIADGDDDESLAWTYAVSKRHGSAACASRARPPLPPPLRVLSPVWVQLSCERRGARGPRLVGTLLDEKHPAVVDAAARDESDVSFSSLVKAAEGVASEASLGDGNEKSAPGDEASVDALARGLKATDLNGGGRPGSGESPDGESPGDKASSFAPLETTSVLASSSVVWAGGATACSREGARARARWWRAQARAALAAMRAAATRPGGSGSSEGKGGGDRLERRKRRAALESLRARVERRRLEDVLVGGGGGRADGRDR